MDGRKRPAAPRSRGSSPPTQRRRQSEQSSIDRYANTAYPSLLPNPPYSRKNSAAGLPATVQTGPAPYSANERHVDQSRRDSNRDVLHGHDRFENGASSASSRKASTDHSPMHVMSPMSNGSGSNTPVQVAPTVPSMLPMTQKQKPSQGAPLNTLSALRVHKSSFSTSAPQTTNGSTTTEVKALKAQLRAVQIEDAKLRSHVQQLEDQVKQFEALPAQLAALKDLVEQRERAAAKGPSSEDIERRLGALENPEPVPETAQLVSLQSDVQAMKMDIKKLDALPEQLKQLQSTATQHGTDIVEAITKSGKLTTDIHGLATLKDDIRAVKEQRQAMKGDAVKIMIQTAIQPEVKKIDAFRIENEKALKEISTTVEANQKICDDLNKRNLPGQLQTLQHKINKAESNDGKTDKRMTTLEESLKNLRRDNDDLYEEVKRYIGPIKKAQASTNETVLERIEYLEEKSRSLRKEQDVLTSEYDKLSTKVYKFPAGSVDTMRLAEVVASLGEDIKKLTEEVNHIKILTNELQQHTCPARNASEMRTSLSDEQTKLVERVGKLETAPDRSALPAPSIGHNQLNKSVESLVTRVSNLDKALKRVELITGQVRNFQSEQSKVGNTQRFLQAGHHTIINQIQTLESEQARLSNEHKAIADQVKTYRAEQESLTNQQKAFQTEQTKLFNEHKRSGKALEGLESRVTAPEKTVNQTELLANEQAKFSNEQKTVSNRIAELDTIPRTAVPLNQTAGHNEVDVTPISSEMADIQQRLRSLEDNVSGEIGLNTIIDGLQDDVEKIGADVHAYGSDLGVLQKSFSAIFADNFDPFRASVEEQLKAHNHNITQHSESLAKLQEQVTKSRNESPAPTFTASQLQLLSNMVQNTTTVKEDLSRLQDSVRAGVEQRNAAVEELRKQMALKQDIVNATQANDVVKAAVRNLQNQYDNISTDDLHQKMVHWFLQQYPSTSASMVQQFAVIQHEVGELRNFTDQINRIPNGTQTMSALAQIGPQLIALVQSPPGSRDSPEMLAKTSEALKTINEAMAKAHKQIEGLMRTVGSLQTSMHTLNSNNTPFVRTESLVALERSIRALRADLDAGFAEERQARNEFVTKASQEHDQRVDAEKSIRLSIKDLTTKVGKEHDERVEAEQSIVLASNERFKELETGKIKKTSDQVEGLQAALAKIRTNFDEVLKEFITPTNKELLNRLPTLFLITGQLQGFLEDLNQNLPKGPLDLEWTCDLNAYLSAIPAPESDESHTAARKGKSKQ